MILNWMIKKKKKKNSKDYLIRNIIVWFCQHVQVIYTEVFRYIVFKKQCKKYYVK